MLGLLRRYLAGSEVRAEATYLQHENAWMKEEIAKLSSEVEELKQVNELLVTEGILSQVSRPDTVNRRRKGRDGPCGKIGYSTPKKALRANGRNGHNLRTYRCEECNAWHVTKRRG